MKNYLNYQGFVKFSLISIFALLVFKFYMGFSAFSSGVGIKYLTSPGVTVSDAIAMCDWSPVKFMIFSGNVFDSLVYFSHLLPAGVMFFAGLMFLMKDWSALKSRIFFTVSILFATWSIFDLILWAHNIPWVIMLFWSLMAPIEGALFLGFFYYIYVDTLSETEIRYDVLLNALIPLAPVFALWATGHSLEYFDLTNCDREAKEGWVFLYTYGYEAILFIAGLYLVFKKYLAEETNNLAVFKKILTPASLLLVMFSMTGASIISSITDNWRIAQYGLLFIPLFVLAIVLNYITEGVESRKYIGIQLSGVILVILISALYLVSSYNVYIFQALTVLVILYVLTVGSQIFKAVKRLYVLQYQLESLNQQKNEFLSFATHQLKSPLTAMKWGMETLKELGNEPDDVEQSKVIIDKLSATTNDLIRTVGDLLDISKIEQGGLVIKKEKMEWMAFVKRIAEEFTAAAGKKGLTLNVNISATETIEINADATKLRQVVVNIIDNAIKYTATGSVSVSVKKEGTFVITTVSDTGPGIAPEEIGKLFGKFSRGAAGKGSGSAGSGLGLYLVKNIVALHNGEVWAESDGIGQGSQFIIKLPLE